MNYRHLDLSLEPDELMPACGRNGIGGNYFANIESPIRHLSEDVNCPRCRISIIVIAAGFPIWYAQRVAESGVIPEWCFLKPEEWRKFDAMTGGSPC